MLPKGHQILYALNASREARPWGFVSQSNPVWAMIVLRDSKSGRFIDLNTNQTSVSSLLQLQQEKGGYLFSLIMNGDVKIVSPLDRDYLMRIADSNNNVQLCTGRDLFELQKAYDVLSDYQTYGATARNEGAKTVLWPEYEGGNRPSRDITNGNRQFLMSEMEKEKLLGSNPQLQEATAYTFNNGATYVIEKSDPSSNGKVGFGLHFPRVSSTTSTTPLSAHPAIVKRVNNGPATFGKGPLALAKKQSINQTYSSISNCFLIYQKSGALSYMGSLMSNGGLSYASANWGDGVSIKNYTGYILTCQANLDNSGTTATLHLPIRTQDIKQETDGVYLNGTIGIDHDVLALYR